MNEFCTLCKIAGYWSYTRPLGLMLQALTEDLSVSRRTLDRWINGGKPCPRAVAILKLKTRALPDEWHGAMIDRQGRLFIEGWRQPLGFETVKALPNIRAGEFRQTLRADMNENYIDEIRDKKLHLWHKQKLIEISEQLKALADARLLNHS